MTPISELKFGHHGTVESGLGTLPAEVDAAWGARWIIERGYVDQVWDRTDCIGGDAERRALLEHLGTNVGGGLASAVEERMRAGTLPDHTEILVLDDGVVRAVGRAAGGYFYITAYLVPAVTDPDPGPALERLRLRVDELGFEDDGVGGLLNGSGADHAEILYQLLTDLGWWPTFDNEDDEKEAG